MLYTTGMFDAALFSKHLEDDETVSMIVHKHWLVAFKDLLPPAISFLLALVVLSATQVEIVYYVVITWLLASVVWFVRSFFDYYLDAWIVTNQGIIDLEWHGWFHRQSSRILYSDIQGVSYEINGIFGTILRYGTVAVEKISTGAAVSLRHVPQPRSVEALVLKNMEAYLHTKNMKDSKHVQEILATMVAEHVQLQGFKPKKNQTAAGEEVAAAPRKKGFSSSKIGSKRS